MFLKCASMVMTSLAFLFFIASDMTSTAMTNIRAYENDGVTGFRELLGRRFVSTRLSTLKLLFKMNFECTFVYLTSNGKSVRCVHVAKCSGVLREGVGRGSHNEGYVMYRSLSEYFYICDAILGWCFNIVYVSAPCF